MGREFLSSIVAACIVIACGSDAGSEPSDPYALGSAGGAGAGGVAAAGGSVGGGGVSAGGLSATGGSPDLPAGQLVCGGRQCKSGGHCTATALCPGFFSDCFDHSAGLDTCGVFCQSKGLTCASRSCNSDGTGFDAPQGFTWGSYPAARKAECGTASYPAQFGQDECTAPIWQNAKPFDDVVRCCCR
jgi:hypothetical protein